MSWKPLRFASWFPTLISCSPNLPRVYIRLCKHGNYFTFLHHITIFILWTSATLLSTILTFLLVFISFESALYVAVAVLLGLTIFVCVCNIGIWIKLQHESVFSQHQTKLREADPYWQRPYFLFLYWLYHMLASLITNAMEVLWHGEHFKLF